MMLGLGYDFMSIKGTSNRKVNKWDEIKLKASHSKGNHQQSEKSSVEWENGICNPEI